MSRQKCKQTALLELADQIESEMKSLGLWSPTGPSTPRPQSAFGADSMRSEEWLQQIFLPSLRRSVLTNCYPAKSNVSIAAIRNFDGMDDAGRLIELRLFVKVRAGSCSGPGGECWRGTQRNEALEAA